MGDNCFKTALRIVAIVTIYIPVFALLETDRKLMPTVMVKQSEIHCILLFFFLFKIKELINVADKKH